MDSNTPTPMVLPVKGKQPHLGRGNWLAPNCTVVGDVVTGDDCSIWFGAVVRGDVCAIRIGRLVNIQDGAVLHGTWEKTDLTIGDGASIGHNAIVHGCTVEAGALIGMGAVVMDRAVVGKELWWRPEQSFWKGPASEPANCGRVSPQKRSRMWGRN